MEVLAINPADRVSYGPSVAAATTIPWLQDTAEEDVWERWGVTKDEFRIVGSDSQLVTVTNLGFMDLSQPENQALLRGWLLAAAQAKDTDTDYLPDFWERNVWGDLSQGAAGDGDDDGQNNFAEFAFGTDPTDPRHRAPLWIVAGGGGSLSEFRLVYRRRLGSWADYWLERSSDFADWKRMPADGVEFSEPINLYDGSGMAEVRVTFGPEARVESMGFVRVRAAPN